MQQIKKMDGWIHKTQLHHLSQFVFKTFHNWSLSFTTAYFKLKFTWRGMFCLLQRGLHISHNGPKYTRRCILKQRSAFGTHFRILSLSVLSSGSGLQLQVTESFNTITVSDPNTVRIADMIKISVHIVFSQNSASAETTMLIILYKLIQKE